MDCCPLVIFISNLCAFGSETRKEISLRNRRFASGIFLIVSIKDVFGMGIKIGKKFSSMGFI